MRSGVLFVIFGLAVASMGGCSAKSARGVEVRATNQVSAAIKVDGTAWTWGHFDFLSFSPTTPSLVPGLTKVVDLVFVEGNVFAVQESGELWPASLGLSSVAVSLAGVGDGHDHIVAAAQDGTVWECYAVHVTDRFAQVAGLSEVIAVAAGRVDSSFSVALKADGTVWTWGENTKGELGDGTTTSRMAPAQVGGLGGVVAISANRGHVLALKNDGTVWAWGDNAYGQLGDGTTDRRTSPVQVSGLTGIVSISAAGSHSLAVNGDGSVWAWGSNSSGQLGDGSATSRSTPVQVSELGKVVSVAGGDAHSLAAKADGTVWAWGNNSSGQLGDGTTTSRKAPVEVW